LCSGKIAVNSGDRKDDEVNYLRNVFWQMALSEKILTNLQIWNKHQSLSSSLS
jgi:hypothetical protein